MKGIDVKKKIENTGFSLTEVASKLEISKQLLDSWLKSDDIKFSKLISIAKAVNKNLDYFIGEYITEDPVTTNKIKEPNTAYKITCPECEAKERLIEQLQKENDRLWKMIEGNNGRKQDAS